jgi:hypothetical protein
MKKDYKMRKTFRLSVKVKNCDTEFKEGMGKGVLLYQDRTYNLEPEEYTSPLFMVHLSQEQDKLIKSAVKCEIETIIEGILTECINCGILFDGDEMECFCSDKCAGEWEKERKKFYKNFENIKGE